MLAEVCFNDGKPNNLFRVRVDVTLKDLKEQLDEIIQRLNHGDTRRGKTFVMNVHRSADKIHATVRKSLVKSFQAKISERSLYELEQIMIGFNEGPFKLTRHKYKITMMQNSRWIKIQNETNIPLNNFDFQSFESILASTVEEKIVDVIGHIVEKDALRETEKNCRKSGVIDLTLEDLENRQFHCSLWGNYTDKFLQYMEGYDMSTPAILMQYCKQQNYVGMMRVSNSFFGTNLIINGDYPEFADYKSK
ncbi:DUF223 domain protein [Medicago truncatula]|uniref:DUF223 domain protein n=1 Tax=Medicago truncatula TaxID=3880 RepID=G7KDI4_MEDTR|nr:DUF223 domain protein [Medicago truncatula]